jgi:uncharacterized membrane protein YsdA (DUF1294 family)
VAQAASLQASGLLALYLRMASMVDALTFANFIRALALLFAFWVVYLLNAQATPSRAATLTAVALILSGGVIFIALTSVMLRRPGQTDGRYLSMILIAYLVTSIATFLLYGYDKRAADQAKDARIRGRSLHLLELLGGWPGAFLGVRYYRHKTDWREEFQFKITTWLIALVHIVFWLLWSTGVIRPLVF